MTSASLHLLSVKSRSGNISPLTLLPAGLLDGKPQSSCLQVLEKHRATIEFEVSEDDVEGHWLKNGAELSLEERFSYVVIRKVHRITISETFRSDAGEYTFIAGKNRSSVNLRVNSKSPCWTPA